MNPANSFDPGSLVFYVIVFIVLATIIFFVKRYLARADKIIRQCPNCGGWETYGLRKQADSTVYDYTCRLCNHTWSWDQTTPYPAVTERPELIAEGKARLAQQARDNNDRNTGGGGFGAG